MEQDTQFLTDFQQLLASNSDLTHSGFYSHSAEVEFYIVDAPPVCILATALLSFSIHNPQQTKIHLLAIDQGLDAFLVGYLGKRPEGLLFNQSDFCFVELKLNVTSNSRFTQTERIEEAIAKFDNFIPDIKRRFLSTLAKDFLSLGFQRYEAYIVLPASKYPRFSASTVARRLDFLTRHQVALFETHTKTFS
jgi:hypothetical protein